MKESLTRVACDATVVQTLCGLCRKVWITCRACFSSSKSFVFEFLDLLVSSRV